MIIAMVLSMLVMLVSAGAVSDFVNRHPSVKILALSFLLLIGVMLVAEGVGSHVDKAYIYFAMAFSLLVEMLNLRYRKKRPGPTGKDGLIRAARSVTRPASRCRPRPGRDRSPASRVASSRGGAGPPPPRNATR